MLFKYVLILHLCSFAGQPQCYNPKVMPLEFDTHYDCIQQGYLKHNDDIWTKPSNIY
jgi:hypothetical protein